MRSYTSLNQKELNLVIESLNLRWPPNRRARSLALKLERATEEYKNEDIEFTLDGPDDYELERTDDPC
jgi:hypothetical protein